MRSRRRKPKNIEIAWIPFGIEEMESIVRTAQHSTAIWRYRYTICNGFLWIQHTLHMWTVLLMMTWHICQTHVLRLAHLLSVDGDRYKNTSVFIYRAFVVLNAFKIDKWMPSMWHALAFYSIVPKEKQKTVSRCCCWCKLKSKYIGNISFKWDRMMMASAARTMQIPPSSPTTAMICE